MGWACGTSGGVENYMQGFDGGKRKQRGNSVDLGVNRSNLSRYMMWNKDWIDLAQEEDRWRALMNKEVNFQSS
jgi:hypothetical protein